MVGERYADAQWLTTATNNQRRVQIGAAIGIFHNSTGTFQVQGGQGAERTFLEEVKTRLSDQSEQHLVLTAHQAVNALQAEHLTELRDIMQTVRTLVNTVETQRHRIDQLYSQVATLQVENAQFKQFFTQLGVEYSQ